MYKYVLITLLLFSCTNRSDISDSKTKTLNQISGPITHLDPQVSTGLAASLQLAKVYESLFEVHPYNAPYELIPAISDGLPKVSKDGKEYIFKIKKGISYHNNKCIQKGRTVKAEDFITPFKRIADPKLLSPHYSYWKKHIEGLIKWHDKQVEQRTDYSIPLTGISAIDEHTLKIKLKNRNQDFLHLLTTAVSAPIPIESLDCLKNDLSYTTVGTGAFELIEYKIGSTLSFKKYDKYREAYFPNSSNEKYSKYIKEYHGRKLPMIDKINVKIIKESQPAWLNFMKGKVDYLEVAKDNFGQVFNPNMTISEDLQKYNIHVGAGPANTNLYYFGLNQAHPILKNKKVRQAISLGFNRKEFNKLFFNNTAVISTSFLPPNIRGNSPEQKFKFLDYDPKHAKKILQSIEEDIPELTILVKSKTISRQAGEYFKKEMEKIGIKVKVKAVSWQSLMSDAQKGKFDIFYLAWFVGLPKGTEFFELIYGPNHPGSYNRVGYHNNNFDNLFKKAQESATIEQQNIFVKEMNSIASKELPLIPLVHTKTYFIHHSWLKNYVPSDQFGGLEKYYDIDINEKKKIKKKL
jgi:oligopeptide transport system substrate-binding protein